MRCSFASPRPCSARYASFGNGDPPYAVIAAPGLCPSSTVVPRARIDITTAESFLQDFESRFAGAVRRGEPLNFPGIPERGRDPFDFVAGCRYQMSPADNQVNGFIPLRAVHARRFVRFVGWLHPAMITMPSGVSITNESSTNGRSVPQLPLSAIR